MPTEADLLREYVREVLLEDGGGCRYEAAVIRSLKLARAAGHIKRAACHDANRPDADIRVNDEIFYIEIKSNSRAQMGGGSVGYEFKAKQFYATGVSREFSQMIADILNNVNDSSLHRGLRTLMMTLQRSSNRKMTDIPISGFTPEAWEEAVKWGLLQAINRTFESDVSVIANHYARKNTHYIQIGGAGFFSLGDANPAQLPVPPLEGRVQLELRLAKSGDTGRTTSKAGFRAQARLLTTSQSPYSLDDPDSVRALIQATEEAA